MHKRIILNYVQYNVHNEKIFSYLIETRGINQAAHALAIKIENDFKKSKNENDFTKSYKFSPYFNSSKITVIAKFSKDPYTSYADYNEEENIITINIANTAIYGIDIAHELNHCIEIYNTKNKNKSNQSILNISNFYDDVMRFNLSKQSIKFAYYMYMSNPLEMNAVIQEVYQKYFKTISTLNITKTEYWKLADEMCNFKLDNETKLNLEFIKNKRNYTFNFENELKTIISAGKKYKKLLGRVDDTIKAEFKHASSYKRRGGSLKESDSIGFFSASDDHIKKLKKEIGIIHTKY